MSRGIDRERDLRELLEADGWWVCRAAGSLGDADLVAVKDFSIGMLSEPHPVVRLIEVKSTAAGPYHSFGPRDRADLLTAAVKAGAQAWLAWWPPCKPGQRKADTLTWIPASAWPKTKEHHEAPR